MNVKLFCGPAVFLGLAACATAKPVEDSSSPATTAAVGTAIRWSGSLQPMQQQTGGLGPTGQNKAFGTVTLSSKGSERTVVSISVSTPLQNSTALPWAILPGRCGTGSLPLAGLERFQLIDVSANGRGQLSTEMALALPESGTFHVNIYWGTGQQLSDVMTCANLRRE